MFNKCCSLLGMMCLLSICYGQSDSSVVKVKKATHTIGVQVNPLLHQVLNFSGSNTSTNNPYLITYGIRSKKSGWGVEIGTGYNFAYTDNSGTHSNSNSRDNELFTRIGVGRYIPFGKWFEAGYFWDTNSSIEDTRTVNENSFVGGVSTTTNKTSTSSLLFNIGGGPRVCLSMHITDKVLIGTEASYSVAVKYGKINTDITSTTTSNSGGTSSETTSNTNSDVSGASLLFSSPVGLFLRLKF